MDSKLEDNSKADVGGFKNINEAVDKDFLCTRVRRTAHNVLCLILNSPFSSAFSM